MDINLKLKFIIDDRIIEFIRKLASRRGIIMIILTSVILASAILFAAVKPHTFVPGTTISSSQVNENFDAAFEAIGKAVPIGTIISYGGASAPEGWLLCDGNSYARSGYAELFSVIGTAFGTANSSSFNVPDLRGRFLRGRDGGAGNDPDSVSRAALKLGGNTGDSIGSVQNDDFESHSHETSYSEEGTLAAGSFHSAPWVNGTHFTLNTGGSETRPKNVYVNYIIKY
jgi:microcystin-dependent protein